MKKTNKITFSIIVFFVLVILIGVFIVNPLYKDIKENSKELVSQKRQLSILETKIRNLEGFKILYKNLEDILEKINDLFVNSEVPVEFIGFLETTAEDCAVTLDISPVSSGQVGKDPWPSLTFRVTLQGSFPGFLKFLEKIENSPYLIEIQNLTVNRTTDTAEVKGTLSLKVFVK